MTVTPTIKQQSCRNQCFYIEPQEKRLNWWPFGQGIYLSRARAWSPKDLNSYFFHYYYYYYFSERSFCPQDSVTNQNLMHLTGQTLNSASLQSNNSLSSPLSPSVRAAFNNTDSHPDSRFPLKGTEKVLMVRKFLQGAKHSCHCLILPYVAENSVIPWFL